MSFGHNFAIVGACLDDNTISQDICGSTAGRAPFYFHSVIGPWVCASASSSTDCETGETPWLIS
jgi:hypothetical protein